MTAFSQRVVAAGSAAVLGAAVLTVASATPAQAAVALTCPATVPVYAIDGDGRLKWYGHRDAGGGSWSWASGSGAQIGHGWHGFKRVFSGGNGVIYAVDGSGYLKWYRHTGASTGANTWASGSGKVIGHGWGGFVDVVADGTGVIYALDADGNLRWYRHLSPTTGGTGWASGSGTVIRTGWKAITKLIPGRDGVIFGINTKGLVRWYKHLNPSGGGSTFGTGTGLVTGEEWDRYRTPSGAGAGVFYAVDSGGRLWWERHADPQAGAPVWYERRQIGSGWGSFTSVFADVASCAPASSTGYATGSGGRTLYYVNGRVAAVLTPGARTAVLYGTTVRKFSESTTTATVSTRAWVRLLPGPWSTSASWASSWLSANVGSTSEDILEIASQYITGAPDRYKNGLRYAGDAHYGPVGEEGRIEGSDFNDYLGIPWKYGDRVDEPEPDQKDSLDCSGFVRMVYGYRSGYPMEIGTPTGTALPRRAVQMHASAPWVMVVDGGTAKPTSYAALQPGDLLFWDASTDDGTAIDHVGIYLGVDSNGKHRFVSSRKTVDGPTLGDVGGHSLLDNGTLYDRSWRAAKRL